METKSNFQSIERQLKALWNIFLLFHPALVFDSKREKENVFEKKNLISWSECTKSITDMKVVDTKDEAPACHFRGMGTIPVKNSPAFPLKGYDAGR